MHILFTRPELYSKYFAEKFILLGHAVSTFSIFKIIALKHQKIDCENYTSIIFTSANAVVNLNQSTLLDLKCYCVGEFTAKQAKKKGFRNIIVAGGSYKELRKVILNSKDNKNEKFLYLRGEFVSRDLEKDLNQHNFQVDSFVNYSTIPIRNFDKITKENLKNKLIDIVFIYSKKSAEHFLTLIQNNNLTSQCAGIQLRCLSKNVSLPLEKVNWKDIKLFSPGNEEFCLD